MAASYSWNAAIAEAASPATSITASEPGTGPAQHDVLVAYLVSTGNRKPNVTVPVGWELFATLDSGTAGNRQNGFVYLLKDRGNAAAGQSYIFTVDSSLNGVQLDLVLIGVSGADNQYPLSAFWTSYSAASATSAVLPSLLGFDSPATSAVALAFGIDKGNTGSTESADNGFTIVNASSSLAANAAYKNLADLSVPSGATTLTWASGAGQVQGFMLAVLDAGAAPPPPPPVRLANRNTGPAGLRKFYRQDYLPDTTTAPVTDTNFGFPTRTPNLNVGPQAQRRGSQRHQPPLTDTTQTPPTDANFEFPQYPPSRNTGPRSLRRRPFPRTTITANQDTVLALSGVVATTAVGTLTPARSLALAGSAASASAGSVTAAHALALSGSSATAAAGNVTPAAAVALSGSAATTAAGTLGPQLGLALSGASATSAAGTLAVASALGLSGSAAAVSVGAVGSAHSVTLPGNQTITSTGALGPLFTLLVSGTAATTAVGTVTPVLPAPSRRPTGGGYDMPPGWRQRYGPAGDLTLTLSGVAAAAAVGTLRAERMLAASSQAAPAFVLPQAPQAPGDLPEEVDDDELMLLVIALTDED